MGQSVSVAGISAGQAGINVKELEDLTYEKPLGTARFLKCIRARHQHGLVVVKVAMRPPPTFKLSKYVLALRRERTLLADVPNAQAYQRILETEHCGYLVRQYIHSSLYDRISTRPFLDDIEKKWLAYQLLCALRDCHARNVYHGDIKTENILVTSWNWLYLTDFSSSFKKTYLPEDNPADFSYFFDISGRRTCYLAPERFLGAGDTGDDRGATWAMDIFSVGCVIAELFTETPIFSLSQLFKYRNGEYNPATHLKKIEDKDVRELVGHMIQVEPESRYSAEEYLNFWRRKAFPEYFYSFLHQYMGLITDPSSGRTPVEPGSTNFGEADERIDRVFYDFDKISYFLGYDETKAATKDEYQGEEPIPVRIDIPDNCHTATNAGRRPVDDGTLLFLTLVVASIRNTARATSRIRALDLMLAFAERITDEAKMDRVLPFMVVLLNDKCDMVRMAALRSTTQLLALIEVVSPVNAYAFTEYVKPRLQNMIESSTSPAPAIVRATYASCLASLAHTSLRVLDMIQALRAGGSIPAVDPEAEDGSTTDLVYKNLYDVARGDLVRHFEAHTKALLTDTDPSVRRAFLGSVSSLCVFFGPEKAHDVVLSHLNTYLNDKDWMLKCRFFRTIVGVATYVGSTNLEDFILPLMLQSLTDPEEFVVERVLRSFASMAELGLIQRSKSWEMLDIIARFTMIPNIWVREAAVHFITACTKRLSEADNRCIVLPLVKPYLKIEIRNFDETTILDALRKPLPRQILSMAVTWSLKVDKGIFWKQGSDQRSFSFRGPEQNVPIASAKQLDSNSMKRAPKNEEDEQWLTRLRNLGMTADDEIKLLALKEYIRRTGLKASKSSSDDDSVTFGNIVNLTGLNVVPQTVFFENNQSQAKDRRRNSSVNAPATRSHRKHTITDALLDASTPSEDTLAYRKRSHENDRKERLGVKTQALDVPGGRRTPSTLDSPTSSSPGTRVGSFDSTANTSKLSSRTQTTISRNDDMRSDGTLTPIGSVKEGKMPMRHKSSTMALINRRDTHKSVAETGTDATQAVGEIDATAIRDDLSPSAEDDSKRHLLADLGARTGHTYDGHDPSVVKLLDNLAAENYSVDEFEFGPIVSPSSRKSRVAGQDTPEATWRPQGIHIATFGEHAGPITRVLPSPDHLFFITASDDGTVRVWDTARLEKSLIHKSRNTHKHEKASQIKCITFVENTHAFVSCASDGTINVVKVDIVRGADGLKYRPLRVRRTYSLLKDEHAVWCDHFRSDGRSTLVVATSTSRILAIDLRTMDIMYELTLPLNYGPPTCFVVDKKRTWLLVGTTRGILCLFDLRFRLAVKSWGLSGGTPIRRITLHPGSKSRGKIVCVVGGTAHADVTVWDIVSGQCREVFRVKSRKTDADDAPVPKDLTKEYQPVSVSEAASLTSKPANTSDSHLRTIVVGTASPSDERDSRYTYMVVGGTDRRVRFFDLARVEASITVSGLGSDETQPKIATMHPSPGLVVNVEKRRERDTDKAKKKVSRAVEIAREQKALLRSHLDDVTDVMVLEGSVGMVVSVDRRGCIYAFQ